MSKTKNTIELTDKQCIAIFEFCTKTDMVAYDKAMPTEDGENFVILSPDECNEQDKIFFGKQFYELLTKDSRLNIDDKVGLFIFNTTVYEYPENVKLGKEIAEMLLKVAPTKKEQIALGKIIWQLLYSFEKLQTK